MRKKPIIVYRNDIDWKQEAESAQKYLPCTSLRTRVHKNNLVIGRFSAVPFYREQELEYHDVGAVMINSYSEHLYIADLREWYYDFEGLTPRTWTQLHLIPEQGPFVLKGITNSKKFLWNSHMFAANKKEAIAVHTRLQNDSLIQYQDIVIREYVPLVKLMDGLQGLPITKEFRFFCYKNTILSGGYYWSSHTEDLKEQGKLPSTDEVPKDWLQLVVDKAAERTNFFAIDVAQVQDGSWIVIELNDGQCSGLSENDPDVMYGNLRKALEKDGYNVGQSSAGPNLARQK